MAGACAIVVAVAALTTTVTYKGVSRRDELPIRSSLHTQLRYLLSALPSYIYLLPVAHTVVSEMQPQTVCAMPGSDLDLVVVVHTAHEFIPNAKGTHRPCIPKTLWTTRGVSTRSASADPSLERYAPLSPTVCHCVR